MVMDILVYFLGPFHSLKWAIWKTYICKWWVKTECEDAEIYRVRFTPVGQGLQTLIAVGAGGNCQGEEQAGVKPKEC